MNENERPEEQIPFDDHGIRNDEIIEIMEEMIRQTWKDVIQDKKTLTIQERQQIVNTMLNAWELARDVMDIDDKLRMLGDYLQELDEEEDPEASDDDVPF